MKLGPANEREQPRPVTQIVVPVDLIVRLTPHALRRRLLPATLALRLLEECLDSGLIDAVLDDEASP